MVFYLSVRCLTPLAFGRPAVKSVGGKSSATSQRCWAERLTTWLTFHAAVAPVMMPPHLDGLGMCGAQVGVQAGANMRATSCSTAHSLLVRNELPLAPGTVPKLDVTVRLVDGNNTHALAGRLEVAFACIIYII